MARFFVAVIATVLYSSVSITLVKSAPVPPTGDGRWVNPCGGSDPVPNMPFNPVQTAPSRPISEDLVSLDLMLQTASSVSQELSHIIRTRISDGAANELEKRKHVLDGFPGINATYTSGMTLENMLLKEFERISKIGVFLEQAAIDTYDYTRKVRDLEDEYVEILCQMDLTLGSLNQEVTSPVSREIMPNYMRQITSISVIDQRNYLIIRDTLIIFDMVKTGISQYKQEHNL